MSPNEFEAWIETVGWQNAITAIRNPHEYSLRYKSSDGEAFTRAAEHIRNNGRITRFWKREYIVLNVGARRYWTMGEPDNETPLINRAVNE